MELRQGQSFEAQRRFVRNIMLAEEGQRGEQEADRLINQRIKKFYVTDDYIQVDEEHFKPRVEPLYLPGVEPSSDTLVLFGIDFMSKKDLKAYFADYNPLCYFLDESNCLLQFSSPEATLLAIRQRLRADSRTKFKVEEEEDGGEVGLSLSWTQPREWIELQPYIYQFRKNKFCAKDYQRKLYVRYATNKEKQMGFDRRSFIDQLITRCKLIWENQAKKDESLRAFLENKMRGFRETLSVMGRSNPRTQHSRSRDKIKTATSRQETFNTSMRRAPLANRADGDLSVEIHSRSENTEEFRQMMREFEQLNMNGDSIMGVNVSVVKDKKRDMTGLSGAPEVAYKVVQPGQLRMEFNHERFNYKQYVQESMERDEKKKKVTVYDLTDE